MKDSSELRIGAVNYLNTKPLVYGLSEMAPHAEIVYDLPSRLADGLAAGDLDVALIPSVECFRQPGYVVVSNACIACRGPVLSVKLLSRVPVDRIRTIALDEGSRTSCALVRILLYEKYGIRPEERLLPIDAALDECDADAILMIGDRAMHSPPGEFADVWDLGDQWRHWADLPFVFAMWVAREGRDLRGIDVALSEARDAGVAALSEISDAEAARNGLTKPQCQSYLRDNLHFYLGEREQQGLRLFYERAVALGCAPSGWELEPLNCKTSG